MGIQVIIDQATDGRLNWISIQECPDELLQLQVQSKSNARWERLTVLVIRMLRRLLSHAARWLSMKNDLFRGRSLSTFLIAASSSDLPWQQRAF